MNGPAVRFAQDLGVVAGDGDVGEDDVVVASPPQADPAAGQGGGALLAVDGVTQTQHLWGRS